MEVSSGPVGERFSELFRNEYPLVYRFILRRTDVAHAEDITNETFAIAWQKFNLIPNDSDQARAWLYAVARNHILRYWNSDKKSAALHVRIADNTDHFVISPELEVNSSLDLRKAWQQLTAADQEILTLLGWEELSLSAAARTLGISIPTARKRVKKARAALRRALDNTEASGTPPLPPAKTELRQPRPASDKTAKTFELVNA